MFICVDPMYTLLSQSYKTTGRFTLLEIFEVNRRAEERTFNYWKDYENRVMLVCYFFSFMFYLIFLLYSFTEQNHVVFYLFWVLEFAVARILFLRKKGIGEVA
jgi:hypothetical protein